MKIKLYDRQKNQVKILDYPPGTYRVQDILTDQGYGLETPCNCLGICGKCRVKVSGDLSQPTDLEKSLNLLDQGIRLACTTYIMGDASIDYQVQAGDLEVSDLALQVQAYDGQGEALITSIGLAFDVGTTGVTGQVVDLKRGIALNHKSILNPQTQYGHDVLSRITYAKDHPSGTETLQEVILEGIKGLTGDLLAAYNKDQVKGVALAGNTTMQHLIKGVNPVSLSRAPYQPVFLERQSLEGDILGLEGLDLHLLPSASSFVGADIVCGLYALQKDENIDLSKALFIDIGTNGELVTLHEGNLVATSTAAGPALEGMNIMCGMRAEAGAIDSFKIHLDGSLHYSTIKGKVARGICGSGLIDLIAELVDKGIVKKSGQFNKTMDDRYSAYMKDKKFYLTPEVYLSQKDIRQIQLAKAAIASGISLLYDHLAIKAETCQRVIIAGSFGFHLSETSLRKIGLIPQSITCPIDFVGNTALKGAGLSLMGNDHLEGLDHLSQNIHVLDLSRHENFQEAFVKALTF